MLKEISSAIAVAGVASIQVRILSTGSICSYATNMMFQDIEDSVWPSVRMSAEERRQMIDALKSSPKGRVRRRGKSSSKTKAPIAAEAADQQVEELERLATEGYENDVESQDEEEEVSDFDDEDDQEEPQGLRLAPRQVAASSGVIDVNVPDGPVNSEDQCIPAALRKFSNQQKLIFSLNGNDLSTDMTAQQAVQLFGQATGSPAAEALSASAFGSPALSALLGMGSGRPLDLKFVLIICD